MAHKQPRAFRRLNLLPPGCCAHPCLQPSLRFVITCRPAVSLVGAKNLFSSLSTQRQTTSTNAVPAFNQYCLSPATGFKARTGQCGLIPAWGFLFSPPRRTFVDNVKRREPLKPSNSVAVCCLFPRIKQRPTQFVPRSSSESEDEEEEEEEEEETENDQASLQPPPHKFPTTPTRPSQPTVQVVA